MLGDPELKNCKEGDIIQLQRRGFFRVDQAYASPSVYTGKATPVVLFEIPDGSQAKEKTTATAPANKKSNTTAPVAAKAAQPNANLNDRIVHQGNLVRDLKAQKADKAKVKEAVDALLALKAEFKTQTGQDWTPTAAAAPVAKAVAPVAPVASSNDLNARITQQGNLVRDLKTQKADKAKIKEAVDALLALKAEFKTQTGQDWTPGAVVPAAAAAVTPPKAVVPPGNDLNDRITQQGNLVRDLKTQKTDKTKIKQAVDALLALKAEFKTQTGQDWTPAAAAAPAAKSVAPVASTNDLNARITQQGNLVRDLKAQKADKAKVKEAVDSLLALKAEFKTQTGQDWTPAATTTTPPPAKATVSVYLT